jgi:hypothetical protein
MSAAGGARLLDDATTHLNAAVKLTVRVDLLFGTTSLPSTISEVMRFSTRTATDALKKGDIDTAMKYHVRTIAVEDALVTALGIVIEFTGMSRLARWRHKDSDSLGEMGQLFKRDAADLHVDSIGDAMYRVHARQANR